MQGFHPTVAALPCCLDDTCLQPLHLAFAIVPIDPAPLRRFAGRCTRSLRCVHLTFLPGAVLQSLSSPTTCRKWARFRGGVMQRLSSPLQTGIRLLRHPLPAIPSAALASMPAPWRERDVGFTVFRIDDTGGSVPANTPAVVSVRVLRVRRRSNRPQYHFGLSHSASWARLILTVPVEQFTCVGHTTQPSPRAA